MSVKERHFTEKWIGVSGVERSGEERKKCKERKGRKKGWKEFVLFLSSSVLFPSVRKLKEP